MNELLSMQLFLSVVQAGSFSEAGRQLGLAPSSISRQINALEEELGTALFTRTTRQLSLTEAGTLYEQRIKRIVADVEETRTLVRDLDGEPRGTLRVTAPISLGRIYLAPAIVGFLTRYPEVEVELAFSDRIIDIVGERIDVAIRIGALPDSSLRARRIAKMHRHIYASPGYLEAEGTPAGPADLPQHNCLTFHQSDTGSLWRPGAKLWRLQGPQGLFEQPVGGNLRASSAEVLVQAAIGGMGLILVPDWLVKEHVDAGRLVMVLPDHLVATRGVEAAIYAVYPPGSYTARKVSAFVDHIQGYFDKVLPET